MKLEKFRDYHTVKQIVKRVMKSFSLTILCYFVKFNIKENFTSSIYGTTEGYISLLGHTLLKHCFKILLFKKTLFKVLQCCV